MLLTQSLATKNYVRSRAHAYCQGPPPLSPNLLATFYRISRLPLWICPYSSSSKHCLGIYDDAVASWGVGVPIELRCFLRGQSPGLLGQR